MTETPKYIQVGNEVVKIVSWGTLLGAVTLGVLKNTNMVTCPTWVNLYLMPILVASAVGYITNYIAIWLLFKPYEPWIFPWFQGVVPREKPILAKNLGELIPEKLLPEEELVSQLGEIIRGYLQDKSLIADIRKKVTEYTQRYRVKIAELLVPQVHEVLYTAIQKNLTTEKVQLLYDNTAGAWLAKEDNREWLSSKITNELKERVPDFIPVIREFTSDSIESYLREKPLIKHFSNDVAQWCTQQIDWHFVEGKICNVLGGSQTKLILTNELTDLSTRIKAYIYAPDNQEKIDNYIQEISSKIESFMRSYLEENIPEIISYYLQKDEVWNAIENHLLPMAQTFILHQLKKDKKAIIRGLDLPGKIEGAINGMDMKEVHETINSVADKNLVIIQLLGYLLGGIAGSVLIFVI